MKTKDIPKKEAKRIASGERLTNKGFKYDKDVNKRTAAMVGAGLGTMAAGAGYAYYQGKKKNSKSGYDTGIEIARFGRNFATGAVVGSIIRQNMNTNISEFEKYQSKKYQK